MRGCMCTEGNGAGVLEKTAERGNSVASIRSCLGMIVGGEDCGYGQPRCAHSS